MPARSALDAVEGVVRRRGDELAEVAGKALMLQAGSVTDGRHVANVIPGHAALPHAVVDDAITPARTIVRLAQTPDERDRVPAAQPRRAAA
ncbi:hypothetical protein H7H78_18310 [Mycobacterium shinjukuense]|uniref:Uncharacterized protein n=1 Tax=Mycobacterium shinjukuense TaxID=398694 RepID=A0A7I7MR01_9MYCO|nr:hypothetical protein [Mycobacterium shinjukuense]ORB68243.1 hypothetical protein BST45_11645 [Mycobacterium shinjukuense]BBX74651.1 hypothetical protein MSHI_25570 [Mycobacterium shinjukuense]